MGEAGDIQWWLLPGNHDPDGADGLWDRIDDVKPKNVHTLRRAEAFEICSDVFLLPAPWARIQHGQDLTDWMSGCETPEGALRIGIAHGGVRGFGSEDNGAREIIPPNRAETAKLDYLALGDWHGFKTISPRMAYSGTPEPDRHKSGARGQVLAVTLKTGHLPKIESLPTASYDWPLVDLALQPGAVKTLTQELRRSLETGHPLRQTHARVNLSGEMTVEDWAEFEAFLEEMTGECASFDVRGMSDVRLVVVAEDIDSLDAQGSVRETAERLAARSENSDLSRGDRQIASDALRLLFSYASQTA
jgi:DNA repair exonuclease SbcCD nuclease subunit